MKILAPLLLLSVACTSTEVAETARYLAPNYAEVTIGNEYGRPDGWDAQTVEGTLGWYLQAVPTRPTQTRDRAGNLPDPIQVIEPETQKALEKLVEQQEEMTREQRNATEQTLADQFGLREAIALAIATLLMLLSTWARRSFNLPSTDDSEIE